MSSAMRNSSTYFMFLILAPSTLAIAYADSGAETDGATDPKPLSVAPLDHVEYPMDRPKWLNQSLGFDKDSVRIVVVSGPCDSPEESMDELKVMQRAAVSTYIAELTDSGNRYDFYPITDEQIDDELVLREYAGTVTQGDVTRYEHAVELGFTEEKRREIVSAYKNVEVGSRLGAVGVLTLGGLLALICNSVLLGIVSRRVERKDAAQAAA